MIELSAARIAALTEGRLTRTVAGDLTIDVAKIGTDSRETGAGSVYVAKSASMPTGTITSLRRSLPVRFWCWPNAN